MNKKSIIGLIILLSIFVVGFIIISFEMEERDAQQRTSESKSVIASGKPRNHLPTKLQVKGLSGGIAKDYGFDTKIAQNIVEYGMTVKGVDTETIKSMARISKASEKLPDGPAAATGAIAKMANDGKLNVESLDMLGMSVSGAEKAFGKSIPQLMHILIV